MNATQVLLGSIAATGVIAGVVGTFLLGKRATSGSVNTTTPEKLWEVVQNQLASALERENVCEQRNTQLRQDFEKERERSRAFEDLVRELSAKSAALEIEMSHIKGMSASIKVLENKVNGGTSS